MSFLVAGCIFSNGILAPVLKTYSMINKLPHQTSSSTVYLLSSWLITVACCVDIWDAIIQNTIQITEAMTVSFTDDIRHIYYDNKHVNLPVKRKFSYVRNLLTTGVYFLINKLRCQNTSLSLSAIVLLLLDSLLLDHHYKNMFIFI